MSPALLLELAVAWAAASCCAGLQPDRVDFHIDDRGGGLYAAHACLRTQAPAQAVWDVLTDYDHIGEFVPSIRSSKVVERGDGYLLLDQWSTARAFLFSRRVRVRLKVRAQPYSAIDFEDVSHRDFETYRGSWRLQEDGEGLCVAYDLVLKRSSLLPGFIAKGVVAKGAKALLGQVAGEILRRSRRDP